ncbi:hypothetical protein F2Q69_00037106 [Brassica cretica]|uniref:Uncharacterized protein n=1 Tax=Brassica cretica TaxID=69181 RepID=A0A8S9SPN4_BRACR|nr:hypothetical protein F2Q69_00037106 [Brassica cretica]
MALNNQRRAPRHLALGLADPQIIVPETSYAEAQLNNRRSLIGRVLSPRRVDLHGLLDRLPLDWHADRSRLRGRIIGGVPVPVRDGARSGDGSLVRSLYVRGMARRVAAVGGRTRS